MQNLEFIFLETQEKVHALSYSVAHESSSSNQDLYVRRMRKGKKLVAEKVFFTINLKYKNIFSKVLRSKVQLIRHLATHDDNRPVYKCDLCDKVRFY